MTLPSYFLRRMAMPGGVRLRKQVENREAGICPTCAKPVYWHLLMGVKQIDGQFYINEYYHHGCRAGTHRAVGVRETTPCPKGNLLVEEYRFWVGSPVSMAPFAMCRCCKRSLYDAKGRELHFMDESLKVGGMACSRRLVTAYKKMLDSSMCIVCKRCRFGHEKWGVPLCDDVYCQKEWQFSTAPRVALEVQLRDQAAKAGAEYKYVAPIGAYTPREIMGLPEVKPMTREYCQSCKIFVDTPGHDEIHSAWAGIAQKRGHA